MWAGDAVAKRLEGVQKCLLEATAHRHVLALGEVDEHGGQSSLESNRNVYALDRQCRLPALQMVAEGQGVSVEVPDGVIA